MTELKVGDKVCLVSDATNLMTVSNIDAEKGITVVWFAVDRSLHQKELPRVVLVKVLEAPEGGEG